MSQRSPSLVSQARVGVRDMPRNAAWAFAKVLRGAGSLSDAAAGATSGATDAVGTVAAKGRRLAHEAASAAHLDRGDEGVDALVERARQASEDADQAEAEAMDRARDAKIAAEEARLGADEANARLSAARAECDAAVEARVASAQQEAAEQIRAAEREAAERVEAVEAEERRRVDEELATLSATLEHDVEERRHRAEQAATAAQEAIDRATDAVARAREVADRAQRAADEVASRAARTAEHLHAEDPAAELSLIDLRSGSDLSEHTKAELLELAQSAELEGRTTMSKAELVKALEKRLHAV